MTQTRDLAGAFTDLGRWAEGTSPLYAHLCRRVAEDDELLNLAATVPESREPAHLLLAAVQYCLAEDDAHPLADYYPSLTADPTPPDEECVERFRAYCLTNRDRLEPLLSERRTQTNAVGRCAALYPAISHVARQVDGPLALVELGPSAGLNLLFDRYEYSANGDTLGGDGPPTIRISVRSGDPPLPRDPPAIHSRVGIDLHPLDVTDADDRAWLRALVWPEQTDRHRLLDGALATARADPPDLLAGDMVEALPDVLADIPADVPVCVFDTLVLYQVPASVREAVTDLLEDAAGSRALHWVAGEGMAGDHDGIAVEWTRGTDTGVETDRLGRFEPHGAWIDWDG